MLCSLLYEEEGTWAASGAPMRFVSTDCGADAGAVAPVAFFLNMSCLNRSISALIVSFADGIFDNPAIHSGYSPVRVQLNS